MFGKKNMSPVTLCYVIRSDVTIRVWATITDGKLEIAGQDLGEFVEEVWGDSDYEYWYNFSREETDKLLGVINGKKNPAEALEREFSGESGCRRMRELCEANGIKYEFFSYV